jgi:hypothetical protein
MKARRFYIKEYPETWREASDEELKNRCKDCFLVEA